MQEIKFLVHTKLNKEQIVGKVNELPNIKTPFSRIAYSRITINELSEGEYQINPPFSRINNLMFLSKNILSLKDIDKGYIEITTFKRFNLLFFIYYVIVLILAVILVLSQRGILQIGFARFAFTVMFIASFIFYFVMGYFYTVNLHKKFFFFIADYFEGEIEFIR